MSIAERIKMVRTLNERTQAGRPVERTQAEFAATLGLGRASVANWERGGHVTGDKLMQIAEQEGVSLDWLRTGEGEMIAEAKMLEGKSRAHDIFGVGTAHPPANAFPVRTLPVLAAQDLGGGYMQVQKTNVIERMPMPPSLAERERAYALFVSNNAMAPAFRYGDTAWIDPMMPYAPDTEAVLYKAGGAGEAGETAILATLVAFDDLYWTVEILKPEALQIKLKRENWPSCQRVVGKTARR
jgi:phage repressor protein C with HTH and peptisase S24 domain